MDPVTMLMLLAGGTQAIGTAINVAGKMGQSSAIKRQSRLQQYSLMQNLDGINQQSAFEQNKTSDQLDQVYAAQTNYYAGGNIDPTWGSPALVQAESAGAAEMDRMLTAARAQGKRAETYAQISGVETQAYDKRRALGIGIATDFLNLASSWLSLGMKGQQGAGGAAGGMPGTGPQSIGSIGGGWGRAQGNFSQGYYT